MTAPREVLAQLLSEEQANILTAGAIGVWSSIAAGLETILGSSPRFEELNGRLVMPDEIAGEFEEPHLVAPLSVTTDQDQSAVAYLVLNTAIAAMFFDSQADEPADQEQQTMVMGSAILGQVASAANSIFDDAPNGAVVALDEMSANSMAEILGESEEPGLLLTGTVQGNKILPVSVFLPGTFLDILASSFPAPADEAEDADSGGNGSPVTLSMEDLEGAEVLSELPGELEKEAESEPEPEPVGAVAGPARSEEGRAPTPISAAVHRAAFAPFAEDSEPQSRSNIDLLSGLDMKVTVELGRADLTVSEVLDLGSGSVIELDRLAGEPVDILVNGRIVARGEVVVVDENFGVRVVEVSMRKSKPGEAV